jgi:hypothetical protein
MGFFDRFKKGAGARGKSGNGDVGSGNGARSSVPAPTHLAVHTAPAGDGKALFKYEWRGQLRSAGGDTSYKIKYYGSLHEGYPYLIVGKEEAPALVIAENAASGEEVVLFDGCRHGYDAMFCDKFTDAVMDNRPAVTYYRDGQGEELFTIFISVYNHHFYDEDALEIDEDGRVTLLNGSRLDVATALRDAFDVIQIIAVNAAGIPTEVVSEELA